MFLLVPKFVSAIIYNHNLRSNVTGMNGAGFLSPSSLVLPKVFGPPTAVCVVVDFKDRGLAHT